VSLVVRQLIPEWLKGPLKAVRRTGRALIAYTGTPLRAFAYRSPGRWLHLMPAILRRRWRLDPPQPGSRRVEVGSGGSPLSGFVHVDIDPDSRSLDFLRPGHTLPLPDHWSDELLSVHMIEHVPPPLLRPTLREWFRVLREGGTLRIHTPNGNVLGRALAEGHPRRTFWPIQSAIYGYGMAPEEVSSPERLTNRADHRMLLTFPILRSLLEEAGFAQVEDVSGVDPCHHYVEWAPYISDLCLEVLAVKLSPS
jgi:predicted SAM-dependent methyltransferase